MRFLSEADLDQLKTIFAEQLDRHVGLRVLTKPPSKLYIPGQPCDRLAWMRVIIDLSSPSGQIDTGARCATHGGPQVTLPTR
jgi:hypothetical protein